MQISGKVSLTGYMVHVPPPTVPAAPNINSVTYSTVNTANANISVNVNIIPGSDGGYAVAGYTATSIPGYRSNTSTTNVITITNLTRGQAYTFVANAYHIVGSSANSNVSASYTLAQVPAAPTIGTATANGATKANVTYTASANDGGNTIISYTAISNPGGITATVNQAGSGTIAVTGLTAGTPYTFTVTATNSVGASANSAVSNSVTPAVTPSSTTYATAGTYSFIPTCGLTSVSVVAVGAGGAGGYYYVSGGFSGRGGSGGGLGYKNNYPVTPGTPVTVIVGAGGLAKNYYDVANYVQNGGNSYFCSPTVVKGGGGYSGTSGTTSGGTYTGDGGGNGGAAGAAYASRGGAGGGAGGYSGAGGNANTCYPGGDTVPASSSGAGGGGGGGQVGYNDCYAGQGGGGGVGLYGQGPNGAGMPSISGLRGGRGGGGGSGGGAGGAGGLWNGNYSAGSNNNGASGCQATIPGGGSYGVAGRYGVKYSNVPSGGGGGGAIGGGGGSGGGSHSYYAGEPTDTSNAKGADGGVRIVWPGTTRTFPTTCVSTP